MKSKKYILGVLCMACLSMQAQEWLCPQRVAPGDPMPEQRIEPHMMQMGTMSTPGIGNLTLPPKVPVIMVNFSNYTFRTTKAHADSLFNARTPMHTDLGTRRYSHLVIPHGSVATYFADQSMGKYRPQFDVVGPVTLSKGYDYYGYGADGGAHTIEMIQEACTLVNDSVDFSQYDSDKDGYIDLVFVLFAGFGENDKTYIDPDFGVNVDDLVWPHYRPSSGGTYDGKTLRAYECSNEIDGYLSEPSCIVPAGSGILVHEYSHGVGLPDVYGSGQTKYMGTWDLMDYGCYNMETYVPASYTGYERWFCGWSKPKMMNTAKNDTLRPISSSGDFGVIAVNGSVDGPHNNNVAYWIIENHQQEDGSWDQYAMGEGLILYQIKHHSSWASGANANSTKDGYILQPADGTLRQSGWVGKQGDCYPYNTLDSIVLPQASNYHISAITQEANGDITLKVCGGEKPAGLEAIGRDGEKARWQEGEKVMINGSLYIRRGDKVYTITGNETHIL